MRNITIGQVFKGFILLYGCLFLLTSCVSSGGSRSPWSLSYPTTDKQRAEATTKRPQVDWRTQEKRDSLHVDYYKTRATSNNKYPINSQEQPRETIYQAQELPAEQSYYERRISMPEVALDNELDNRKMITVALLLPMSGKYKHLGESMMNAAQMALFDLDSDVFRLLPKDTKGTVKGAREAALSAAQDNADLVLGPVFSKNVTAVSRALAHVDIPIITYTTDWKVAGGNTYVMGFLPFSQVIRVVNYAQNHGYSKTGFFGPGNDYSNIVLRTLHHSLRRKGDYIAKTGQFSVAQPDLHMLVQDFIGLEIPDETDPKGKKLAEQSMINNINLEFDSVLIPVGGHTLKSVTNMFGYYNAGKDRVRFLGTGLWDDPSLINEKTLHGSWFAAPDPELRADFDKRYKENYDEDPERLASLAYDSIALSIILAQTYNGIDKPYARHRLVTQQGYAGVDGIFRFRSDNLVERGLAVLEVTPTGLKVVDSAPEAFFALKR